jgi:hypothetical protein
MTETFIEFVEGFEQQVFKIFGPMLQRTAAQEQDVIALYLEHIRLGIENDCYPTGQEFKLKLPRLFSERALIKYSILSWYMPDSTRFELQEFLRKKAHQQHFPYIEVLTSTKEIMMMSLFTEQRLKLPDLFGNVLTEGSWYWMRTSSNKKVKVLCKDFCLLTLENNTSKPKTKVFRKGYNDQGSRAEFDIAVARQEWRGSAEQRLLQAQIELRRQEEHLQASKWIREIAVLLQDRE